MLQSGIKRKEKKFIMSELNLVTAGRLGRWSVMSLSDSSGASAVRYNIFIREIAALTF
jgi:hypothetical protein